MTQRSSTTSCDCPAWTLIPGRRACAVCLECGLRAALIIAAALSWPTRGKSIIGALTASDMWFTCVVHGAVKPIVILLLADFAWHVMKTVIDLKLAEAQNLGE